MDKQEQELRRALAARQAGNDAAAADILRALVAEFPTEARAHNMLGMIALQRQDGEGAHGHFSNAIAHDPKEPALFMNVATAARIMGDDGKELAALEGALDCDRLDFMAWRRKAELHQRLDQIGPALEAWNSALQLSARIDPMPNDLAQLLAKAGQWVAEHSAAYAQKLNAGLADARTALPPSQLRRFDACVDKTLGRRTIFSNQCHGLHFPFLPADEFFEDHHFPWMAEIESKTDVIRAEFLALIADGAPGMQPYVKQQPGTPQNIWSELDGSLDWSAYFLWNQGVLQEEACTKCPKTAEVIRAIPQVALANRAPTVFFSILAPGKRIPPHTGVTNVRSIVHLPLIVPSGCAFRVGGETRPWVEGKAFVFDDTIEHEAWNESGEMRAVLIFDVWNPHIAEHEKALLQRLCEEIDASGYGDGPGDFR